MEIPKWIRERVIALEVISEELDAETVSRELAQFGVVEKVQFINGRTSGKRHAFVTFVDAESAIRALNGTSYLPIKPTNPTWFARYEPPSRARNEIPNLLGFTGFRNPISTASTGSTSIPRIVGGPQPPEPAPSFMEPSKLDESNRQLLQLIGMNRHLRSNLTETLGYIKFLKEHLENAEKMLTEERTRRSEAETVLRQQIEKQSQVIKELRHRVSRQPPLVSSDGSVDMQISEGVPSDSGHTNPIVEKEYHPENPRDKVISQPPIPEPYVSAVGPSLIEAFRLLDQIVSDAISEDALTDGPEGPARKKRKLGDA